VCSQQLKDSTWTEQVCSAPCVKELSPGEVSTWPESIECLLEYFSIKLYENGITGREILMLIIDGLKIVGIDRSGTFCPIVD
jgi:hypothetical protein